MKNLAFYKEVLIELFLLVGISIIFLVIYIGGQQILRQGANDPQIQIAEDAANNLQSGLAPLDVIPKDTVNIDKSLAPFLIIFDNQKNPVLSSAAFNGNIPIPPEGVFNYTQKFGEERLTWAPREDIRIAAVIKYYEGNGNSGFALAGRSLREIEQRENYLLILVFIGWASTVILTILGIFIFHLRKEKLAHKIDQS